MLVKPVLDLSWVWGSEKNNSEQVRLQVFCKSRWTNRQVPQFDRQLIPTAGTSNSKGSQTPIRRAKFVKTEFQIKGK